MKKRLSNEFSQVKPNLFYKARHRNIRWNRDIQRMDATEETTTNQPQTIDERSEQQTLQEIERRLNGES